MMLMKNVLIAAALAACLGTAQARSTAMLEPERVMVVVGNQTEEAMKGAVVRGGAKHDWIVQADAPGKLTLKQNKNNKHEAVVEVVYDNTGFQIRYVSSINLNFEASSSGKQIHPTYNRWVQNLQRAISAEVNSLPPVR